MSAMSTTSFGHHRRVVECEKETGPEEECYNTIRSLAFVSYLVLVEKKLLQPSDMSVAQLAYISSDSVNLGV